MDLELEADEGLWVGTPDDGWSPNLSVRPFAEGRGLSVLRMPPARDDLNDEVLPRRLGAMALALLELVPGLELRWGDQTLPTRTPSVTHESAPLGRLSSGHERPSQAPLRVDAGDVPLSAVEGATGPLLTQAIAELELGRLKRAQRLGRQAVAAGEAQATKFVQFLEIVRKAINAVHRRPHAAQTHFALACSFFLAGAGNAAVREAKKSLALDPCLGQAQVLLALERLNCDDLASASALYHTACATLDEDDQWLAMLKNALDEQLHPPAALVSCE